MEYLVASSLVALGFLALRRYVFFLAKVPTASMSPGILPGDVVLVRRLVTPRSLKRGQVVIFRASENITGQKDRLMLKRLIGLPGDEVRLEGHKTLVNQAEMICPLVTPKRDNQVFCLPTDAYLLLGDERTISQDARHWKSPYVKGRDVAGRVLWVLWPVNRMGPVQ